MERNTVFANRLKQLCDERNITYCELAKKSGVPVKRVQRLYYGTISNPNVYVVKALCDALAITVDEFFDTDEFRELRK